MTSRNLTLTTKPCIAASVTVLLTAPPAGINRKTLVSLYCIFAFISYRLCILNFKDFDYYTLEYHVFKRKVFV